LHTSLLNNMEITMKKTLLLIALTCILSACGGHGYEGTYQSEVDSKAFGGMAKMMPKSTLTIGSNYIENEGKRIDMEEIFVRESNGKEYLILKSEQGEESFEITKDQALLKNMGMISIKFVRID
jgi:hypothetical protein